MRDDKEARTRQRWRPRSIRIRFLIACIGFLIVAVGLFTAFWLPRVHTFVLNIEQRETRRQVQAISDGILPFLLQNQFAAIYETLDAAQMRHEEWISLELRRPDGRMIYPLSADTPPSLDELIIVDEGIEIHGEVIARITAVVDPTDDLAALNRQTVELALYGAVISLICFGMLAYLLDKIVGRRVLKLARAAKELARGNFEAELPTGGRDEITALTRRFERMRREIKNQQTSLIAARSDAERAAAAKANFLATMSHEIRTPLNGVIPVAELLLDTNLNATQTGYVKMILDSGSSLSTIIDDILDLSKMDAGKFEVRERSFELLPALDVVMNIMSTAAEKKGIELRRDIGPELNGVYLSDPARLRQVLLNLIGNAVKFTERGSVTLQVQQAGGASGTNQLRFAVIDTGIGIPVEEHEKVFDRFSQVDGEVDRTIVGSGLGLHISKSIVEAMGGRIALESAPGMGSKFCFTVPMRRIGDAPETEARTEVFAGRREQDLEMKSELRILVADDNEYNLIVTQAVLRRFGIEATLVENGQEAVEHAARERYDAILMDVQMPVMDGLTAVKTIRDMPPPFCDVPVIAVSASVFDTDVAACLDAGMNDFLAKPLRRKEVAKLIEELEAALDGEAA